MGGPAPSLHRESTDSLIPITIGVILHYKVYHVHYLLLGVVSIHVPVYTTSMGGSPQSLSSVWRVEFQEVLGSGLCHKEGLLEDCSHFLLPVRS